MPKRRRQARIPTPAWDHRPPGSLAGRLLGRSFQFYGAVVIAILLVVGLGVVGAGFLTDYIEDQRRPGSTALQVGDTKFRLDYFTSRLQMFVAESGGAGADAAQASTALPAVADVLVKEATVRAFADEMDVSVSEEELLEAIASRLAITAGDETFDIVYEQELARTGLSDEQYRELVEASVLEAKLKGKFLDDIPETAESARYRQILVSTDERAQELKGEIESGGDFAQLAAENSLDPATREDGGEAGWVPRGVLDAAMEQLIFTLEPDEITTIPMPEGVYVVQLLEKADDREVEEDYKEPLAERAFQDWVREKRGSLTVVNNMDITEGDIEKIQWAVSRVYTQEAAQTQAAPGG